jgi:sialidase-1
MKGFYIFCVVIVATTGFGCKENNNIYPDPPGTSGNKFDEKIEHFIPKETITKTTVFSAGDDEVHSYRIPSLITTKTGALILACEARKVSWMDKSPTDIALKRSTDGGLTWSSANFVTNGAIDKFAYMDPCLLADNVTGKLFLFVCRWPESPQDGSANIPFLLTSEDDGVSWSAPIAINEIIIPGGFIHGFGPGSGIQMQGSTYKNRLIVPTRQKNAENKARNRTIYSDDHGLTWKIGNEAPRTGEYQIAETPLNGLYYNLRFSGGRAACYSSDGGISWGPDIIDKDLPSTVGGCQGSVFGSDKILLYSGIQGGTASNGYDDRCKLTLYRSTSSGYKWGNRYLLHEKAAGYSCISKLNDGRIVIIFEAADGPGFTKSSTRPAGWMRLDLITLPKETLTPGYWYEY